jgi:hypothetical protein
MITIRQAGDLIVDRVLPKFERDMLKRAPKVRKAGASIPVLAQASKPTSTGRGTGRRFTKASAAGAATARAKSLAPEQRRDIARQAAVARWGGRAAKSGKVGA